MNEFADKAAGLFIAAFLAIFLGGGAFLAANPSGTAYAQGDTSVLAFTSDVHNDQRNYAGEARLGTWIDNVVGKYGKIDAMAFGGDMAQYNSADARYWSETKRVMAVVEGKGIAAYYTTGNHEYDHDSKISNDFYPRKNKVTAKYTQNDWAVENGSNYRIYCMGVGEASNYTFVNNAYTANQVTTLRKKLAAVDNSKPIFIITHFPLHYAGQKKSSRSRTIARASDIIDVLNAASNGGTPNDPSDDKKIVFVWGHNHSLSNPSDSHYDTIYQKGSSLQCDSSHSKKIQFYYAAAGSMSDTEKGDGSRKVQGKGLVATVSGNNLITLTYHKANGAVVTQNGGPFAETAPPAVESLAIDEAVAGQAELSVEAGKNLRLNASIKPSGAIGNTVTWSSSDESVATVAALTQTGGPVTGTSVQVRGLKEGVATITATLTDAVSGNDFTASVVVHVTPPTTSATPYVLTDTLTPGKNYLIVSAYSGDAYALKNDNGTIAREKVAIEGDTIYSGSESIVFEAQGSGATINDLRNGDRYLKASSSGLQLLATAGSSRPWEYDGGSHKLTNYKSGSNPTHYYVYHEANAFASSTSTSATHVVYLFEQVDEPVDSDVAHTITWKRLAGSNALQTMRKITQEYGKASVAIVTTNALAAKGVDAGYKDALAGVALAGGFGAPMLTTSKGALSAETKSELKRMGVRTVFVIGSAAEVATKVDAQIRAMGIAVKRISGKSASVRAVAAAKQVKGRSDTVIIATQNNFRDALAVSSYVYASKSPILYAEANKQLSAATIAYIKSAKFKKAIVVGGPVALPASIESQLKSAGIAAGSITRLAGSNQYKTARVIAEWACGQLKNGTGGGSGFYQYAKVRFQPSVKLSADRLGVARADDNKIGWKDALAGAALCGKNRSAILLADAANDAQAVAFVKANASKIGSGYVFGGTLAVPKATYDRLVATNKSGAAKASTSAKKVQAPDGSSSSGAAATQPRTL